MHTPKPMHTIIIRKAAIALLIALTSLTGAQGQAIGSWTAYPALCNATYNEPADNKIYSLTDGNLYSYNTTDTEVYIYTRLNGLNDNQIAFIRYVDDTQKLVVAYEDGNIDLIYPDDDVRNMNALKDKGYTSLTINNLCVQDEMVYICTNFGVVELNTDQEVFENTYSLDLDVRCVALNADTIFLSTGNAFYAGNRGLNLLDANNWEYQNTNNVQQMAFFDGQLIGYKTNRGIVKINTKNFTLQTLCPDTMSYYSLRNGVMIAGNQKNIYILKSLTNIETISQENTFQHLAYDGNTLWASQGLNGLQSYNLSNASLTPTMTALVPNSPVRDYFFNMHYTDDGERLLVAGSEQNYSDEVRDGTLMYYQDETWYNFKEDSIEEQTGKTYTDLTCLAQDPLDDSHHFAGSARHGLYEYRDLTFVENYDATNSPLQSALGKTSNDYVRTDALQYDSEGNLWMANAETDTIITVLKNDGSWARLYYEELEDAPNCTQIQFDSKGRLWMNSKRLSWNGLFVLDYNGTIDDTTDDTHLKRDEVINQDGTEYDVYYFNCFTIDKNEQIWVGTSTGLFIIEDPDEFIYDDDFTYTQIKIARDDGTDYADYLLNGVDISAIAVDGANRKWIGTSTDGIYLVSEDGQETLQHFTSDNSPMPSDRIESIAVNNQTGEVMIGTYLGLVSYTADATEATDELEKSNVRVWPNPVRPDYNGVITVDGLTYNAEVKITTVTGQLVASGRSSGGRFTWDGKDGRGRRVASGVYNIISTNQEGKKAVVNRVTFIH